MKNEMMLMRKSRTTLIRRRRRMKVSMAESEFVSFRQQVRVFLAVEPVHVVSPARFGHLYRGIDPSAAAVRSLDAIAVFPHHGCSFRHIEEQVGLGAIDRAL